jgi:hypothetical protein
MSRYITSGNPEYQVRASTTPSSAQLGILERGVVGLTIRSTTSRVMGKKAIGFIGAFPTQEKVPFKQNNRPATQAINLASPSRLARKYAENPASSSNSR